MSKISFESGEFQFNDSSQKKAGRRTVTNSAFDEQKAGEDDGSYRESASNYSLNSFNQEDDPVRMQLLNLHGGTGEYNSNRTSPRKVATRVPGLAPVNVDSSFEFYLGVRNPQTKRYDGDRLFYEKTTTELEPCSGSQPHAKNQLWRF